MNVSDIIMSCNPQPLHNYYFITVIDCNKPTMDNFTGNVTYNNTTYGNMAIFTCPGNCSQNTSVCNENGNWTKTSLDCFRKFLPNVLVTL